MRISFHGAAGGVTGSCSLVETSRGRVLVDCGLFQGMHEPDNSLPFGFDPRDIDAVVLTHAHLDHCGRLPMLVRDGFRGRIHATAPTRELTRLVLLDSAGIMRGDARRAERRGGRKERPLYDELDVMDALDHFAPRMEYDQPREIIPGAELTLLDAGHILGSACAFLTADGKRLAFTGDLGNTGKPLVRDPTRPPPADVAIVESTYGDRDHRPFDESVRELYDAVTVTIERGGNVVIPSFAIERAQDLLYVLGQGLRDKNVPERLHVYLDSPMAISATRLFGRYSEHLDAEARRAFGRGEDPTSFGGLDLTFGPGASRAIAKHKRGAVIIAGSGMCTGGRVLKHLSRELPRKESSIIFVSFAPGGTLARRIIDGEKDLRVMGRPVKLSAQRFTINGFSAHAGQSELLAWHRATGAPRTFLVHGEEGPREALAGKISASKVERPLRHEAYDI